MTTYQDKPGELYIGLMSGTSMDGIDAVLVDFQQHKTEILAKHSQPFPATLRTLLLSLHNEKKIDIHALLDCDVQLGEQYALAVTQLAHKKILQNVRAIGCHGQTLWHRPRQISPRYPTSWQIGDPNIIAERTGMTTVADFRRRDIAAGGEGAPLVTAFHQTLFHHAHEQRVILNLGGIANITVLNAGKITHAFDTGPGNALMDIWVEQHRGRPFDTHGEWADSGEINTVLLELFLQDPYFSRPPPKSTGREYFNMQWLQQKLEKFSAIPPQNVQATLCELTAISIKNAIDTPTLSADRIIVCGGGIKNDTLMRRLTMHCACPVHTSADFGILPQWVEAAAFAWLARQRLLNISGNIPQTTGAMHDTVLGALYSAKTTKTNKKED